MSAPILKTRGLRREFVTSKPLFGEPTVVKAVDGVDLDIEAGDRDPEERAGRQIQIDRSVDVVDRQAVHAAAVAAGVHEGEQPVRPPPRFQRVKAAGTVEVATQCLEQRPLRGHGCSRLFT